MKMKEEYFAALSTILSPNAVLKEVNSRYGLAAFECRLWSMGLNDVYQIETSVKVYYLRISHANRFTREDYEEEIAVIIELQNESINTCNPLKQVDGTYLWEITALEGKRYAVLFDEVKQDSTMNLYYMGMLVANIHEVSDKKCFNVSRESFEYNQFIAHPLQVLCESKQLEVELIDEIESKAVKMWNCITNTIPKESPYYGYCHGDIHRGNLYFYQENPQVFDFDCMGYGYRAYELSVYLWDELSANDKFMNSKQWEDYLNGYDAVRKITNEERNSIFAFASLRQLWFMGLMIDTTKINNSWDGINHYFLEGQYHRFQFLYDLWNNQ